MAGKIWESQGFPLGRRSKSKWLCYNMAMRARIFDDWTETMLKEHEDALVLHIGCGLDSRCQRVRAPYRNWYDCDFPDVISIRKMYYTGTEKYHMIALNAAETGKLVLATLHTNSSVSTAERIVNVFPESRHNQILLQLSMVLRGVVSQTLLRKVNGGRVAAFELLLNTSGIRSLIAEGKIHMLPSYLETGSEAGMMTMEMSLAQLVKDKIVSQEEAFASAPNPNALRKLLDKVMSEK